MVYAKIVGLLLRRKTNLSRSENYHYLLIYIVLSFNMNKLPDWINLARYGVATQESTSWYGDAVKAIDGDRSGDFKKE